MTPPGEGRYAGFWIRAAARSIDLLIILIAYNLFYLADRFGADAGWWPASGDGVPSEVALSPVTVLRGVFFFGFPVFYYVYLHGAFGQTFGKMILGIRVLNRDGSPIDYRKAFLRWLGYFVSGALTLGIGYAWAGFDRRKEAFHDKLCRTIVVREPRGPLP